MWHAIRRFGVSSSYVEGHNKVMKEKKVEMLEFKGFMADNAQANYNVVHIVFGWLGDPSQPLHNKERTCLFHYVQSMGIHINNLIRMPHLHVQHMEICNNYKTLDEINANCEVVRSWWHLFGVASGNDLEEFNHWLSFWHLQFH